MKVIIKNKEVVYQGFFKLEKALLQFEKLDGHLSREVVRENFFRGNSVAALVYDLKRQKMLLVRQFRYPVYTTEPKKAWLLEIVAGSCEPGEKPRQTLLREMQEELGLDIDNEDVQFLSSFYTSPGGTSERLYLFSCETDLSSFSKKRGGEDEEEDIEIILLSFDEVVKMLDEGKVHDAKTIIALQIFKNKVMNSG